MTEAENYKTSDYVTIHELLNTTETVYKIFLKLIFSDVAICPSLIHSIRKMLQDGSNICCHNKPIDVKFCCINDAMHWAALANFPILTKEYNNAALYVIKEMQHFFQ